LPEHLAAELGELLEDAERYAAAAQSQNTTRAYASDWAQFETWAERYNLNTMPAPAAVIALYITALAKRGLAVSTIRRRAAAIARAHRQAGYLSPTSDPRVLTILEGIARVHGSARTRRQRCSETRYSTSSTGTTPPPPPGYATARCYSSASQSGSEDRSS
jgi:hypothetical protein